MTPVPILVLKDLTSEGFQPFVTPPNTIDESKIVFQRIAQFHAASFYMAEHVST